jgi:drug/metabolite transporter (DMT)-like permease
MTPTPDTPAVVPDEDTAPVPSATLLEPRPLRGVLLVAVATLFFALHDTANKLLLADYDVPVIAAVRYTMQTVLMLAILGPRRAPELVTTRRTWLVLLRALSLVLSTLFFGLGLQLMPIPETTAIGYIAPLIVVLLARPFLNETIGPWGWLAAILGFSGMLLIVRPGGGLDPLGVVFIICNISATVVYYMLSRVLAHSEKTMAMMFYSSLVGAICFGLATPWFIDGDMPDGLQLALFLSLGIFAGVGHFLFTAAYRFAEASLVAPVSYVHLVWAGLLGWIIFGHVPDPLAIAGMVVVILAGVLVAFRSLRSRHSGT